jgi:hypothetical protein
MRGQTSSRLPVQNGMPQLHQPSDSAPFTAADPQTTRDGGPDGTAVPSTAFSKETAIPKRRQRFHSERPSPLWDDLLACPAV